MKNIYIVLCVVIMLLCVCIATRSDLSEVCTEENTTVTVNLTTTGGTIITEEISKSEPYTTTEIATTVETTEKSVSSSDEDLLTIVIYCEAGSDSISDETRMMVGNVVLNRVKSEAFPNTVNAVLMQKGQYGMFSKTGVVLPSRAKNEQYAVDRARKCAKRLLNGERVLPDNVVYQSRNRNLGSGIYCVRSGIYFNYM